LPNAEYRTREYLTEREVERLMKAAGNNRHGHRDATMILMAFRHGLRASELCSLRWDQADLVHGRLHVNRLKNGIPSVHPLTGIELRALRRLQREQKPGRYVFMSERGAPMSAVAFRPHLKMIPRPSARHRAAPASHRRQRRVCLVAGRYK
jgi:type 1 fimbriae regulatory protein FimE